MTASSLRQIEQLGKGLSFSFNSLFSPAAASRRACLTWRGARRCGISRMAPWRPLRPPPPSPPRVGNTTGYPPCSKMNLRAGGTAAREGSMSVRIALAHPRHCNMLSIVKARPPFPHVASFSLSLSLSFSSSCHKEKPLHGESVSQLVPPSL